jgi:hypothetical protein
MALVVVPSVTATQAQAEASLFLSSRLPGRISASNRLWMKETRCGVSRSYWLILWFSSRCL